MNADDTKDALYSDQPKMLELSVSDGKDVDAYHLEALSWIAF